MTTTLELTDAEKRLLDHDESAITELALDYRPLAYSMAKKHKKVLYPTYTTSDVHGAAMYGLMFGLSHAHRLWQPDRGKLSAYLYPYIKRELCHLHYQLTPLSYPKYRTPDMELPSYTYFRLDQTSPDAFDFMTIASEMSVSTVPPDDSKELLEVYLRDFVIGRGRKKDRDKSVIRTWLANESLTNTEIGAIVNLSNERVRQVKKAFKSHVKRLREAV